MSRITDYSKWDKMVISDDEEEEEEYDEEMLDEVDVSEPLGPPIHGRPRVTKLEGPTSITIGGLEDGGKIKPETDSSKESAFVPAKAKKQTASLDLTAVEAGMTKNGGRVGDSYMFSQTKTEVLFNVIVPAGTKAKDVKVKLHAPSASNPSSHNQRLDVSVTGDANISGMLAYGVEVEEGEDLDWELMDFEPAGRRVVQLTLVKKVPGMVVLWWSRIFEGDQEIDTKTIVDRKFNQDHQAVWQEAHAMFQKKISERTITEIDCSE